MRTKYLLPLLLVLCSLFQAKAQDNNLLNLLDDSLNAHKTTDYVTGTFKATRIVNLHTTESPAQGVLNFVIQHRFGKLNDGAYNFFGLDNATLRLAFDYGITDRLAIGIGRSSLEKTFDGFAQYKLFRQTAGSTKMPVSVSAFASIATYTQRYTGKEYLDATYRTSYTAQLIIARKFSRIFSAELVPTFIHYNLVPTIKDKNNVFAVGAGGRLKISKRMSINAEYNYLPANQVVSTESHSSFSLGWDIETGGHIFQLVFSNSQGIIESQYIGRTTGSWGKGDIYFGFNMGRPFNITKHAKSVPAWVK